MSEREVGERESGVGEESVVSLRGRYEQTKGKLIDN